MIWQCTSCDTRSGNYDDPMFVLCKMERHQIVEMLDITSIVVDIPKKEKLTSEQYTTTLEEKRRKLEGVMENNFPRKFFPLEVCLSVKAQQLIEDITQPFALFMMGQPSSYKSTILEIISTLQDCYKSDKFTPKSFVSHAANIPKTKLTEIDLLPKIKGKTLITPELAPLFTGNEEVLVDTFGILTRVLDGRGLELDSGVHGKRGYSGDYCFTWLGAVVDIPHKVWKTVGNLGAKWYYLRLPEDALTPKQKKESIKKSLQGIPYEQKITQCQENLVTFWQCIVDNNDGKIKWDKDKDDVITFERIIEIATLLSKLRASIPTWHTNDPSSSGTNYNFEMPTIEDPGRTSSALYNLAKGHAILDGRNYITKDDLPVVIAVALSSAERERVKFLQLLLGNNGKIDVEVFVRIAGVSENTARKEMQKMQNLGLVNLNEEPTTSRPKYVVVLKDEFAWFLSLEFKQYWNKFTPLHTPIFSADSKTNSETQEGQTVLTDTNGEDSI